MKTVKFLTSIAVLGLSGYLGSVQADARDWYLQQLLQPSRQLLEMEQQGRVTIYDGLRDTDVNRALDEQFDRIESMMFIGTIVTDENGEPLRDSKTGKLRVENDGC